jgi:hypothetical protein
MGRATMEQVRSKSRSWREGGHDLLEAVERLADAHLGEKPVSGLDARDRSALAYAIMALCSEYGIDLDEVAE